MSFPFFKDFSALRLPGVLQRIGLVFFVASILFLNFNWKVLLGVFICILIGYWYVMTQIPINGEAPLLDKVSNLATVIDTKVLTRAHMWKIYDPEGLLSTIPAIATSIFGMLFGKMLISQNRSNQEKLMFFIVIGIVALAAGYLFSIIFPLNKALWTSSFVLVTGGWACLIYALIYYITDVLKKTKWGTPAIIFGSNAITVFFRLGWGQIGYERSCRDPEAIAYSSCFYARFKTTISRTHHLIRSRMRSCQHIPPRPITQNSPEISGSGRKR